MKLDRQKSARENLRSPTRRHPNIIERRCPSCFHHSCWLSPSFIWPEKPHKCSRCGHRFGEEK